MEQKLLENMSPMQLVLGTVHEISAFRSHLMAVIMVPTYSIFGSIKSIKNATVKKNVQ